MKLMIVDAKLDEIIRADKSGVLAAKLSLRQ